MNKIAILLFSIVSSLSFGQDSAKVLFIGNSYTYVNDLPQLLTDLAASLGDNVYHDDQTMGGATFQTHANNTATYTKIHANVWDFVVLQAQSQEPSFPDSQVDTETVPYAIQLADSVYANYFCSEALFFMTWGREDGDPQWGPISTYDGMQDRLRSAYMRMADSVQGAVAPVGEVWRHVRTNYPAIQLYSADGSHPSIEGSYLSACAFYASIFRKSPVGAPFISSVDPTVAGQLQAAAEWVVLDSLTQWNLRPLSEHTQADYSFTENLGEVAFQNESTKAQTYGWDFGDGQTSTDEDPVHMYAANGVYTVTLIAQSPCDTDTMSYDVVINSLGIHDAANASLLLKNLGDGIFEIASENMECITVLNALGEIVMETKTTTVNLSEFASGMYVFSVATKEGVATIRVVR